MIKTIYLVVTQQCNINCAYCFVDKTSSSLIYEEWLNIYTSQIENLNQPYKIIYFGGEPLLNFDLIIKISKFLQDDPLCNEQIIVSNGLLLTNEIATRISDNNIKFMYSFDGLWNSLRYPNENEYTKNIELIKQLTDVCQCCITPQNLNLLENYSYVLEKYNMYLDFTLVEDVEWDNVAVDVFDNEFTKLCNWYIKSVESGIIYKMSIIENTLMHLLHNNIIHSKCENCKNSTMHVGINDECLRKNMTPIRYINCDSCEWKGICTMQCEKIMNTISQESVNNICKVYSIIFKNTIRINHYLKNNDLWQQKLLRSFNEN